MPRGVQTGANSHRLRTVARASSRFARFAQAIRNRKLTAPASISRARRTSPTTACHRGSAVKRSSSGHCTTHFGNFSLNCSVASAIWARAISTVTPGLKRAATCRVPTKLVLFGSACSGSQSSAGGSGSDNEPSTPTTTQGRPPSRIALPIKAGLPPKRRCHSLLLTPQRGAHRAPHPAQPPSDRLGTAWR